MSVIPDEHYQPHAQDFSRMNHLYDNNSQLPGHSSSAHSPFLMPSLGQLNQGWNGLSHHNGSFPNSTLTFSQVQDENIRLRLVNEQLNQQISTLVASRDAYQFVFLCDSQQLNES